MMSNRAPVLDKPFHFRRRVSLLGSGLCSLLVLVACTPKDRAFPSGGSGGGGAGGSGGAGTSSATTGAGGAKACETSDPDCECVADQVVARDVDQDQEGTRLCEAAPGADCDDGDPTFIKNECDGCNKAIGGTLGAPCGACGALQCLGDSALQCGPPNPVTHQCSGKTVQVCGGDQWVNEKICSGVLPNCHLGECVVCVPGTFKCGTVSGTPVVIKCLPSAVWENSWSISCSSLQTCNATTGKCVGAFHPRDLDFDVPALLRGAPGAEAAPGSSTQDVLDRAMGFAFG
jgi:hypothetical protein